MISRLRCVALVAALAALAALAAVPGCATDTTRAEALRLAARGALLLDVRSRAEHAERHLPGSVNIPIEELRARLSTLPRRRDIVVYCHSGARAGIAALWLRRAGFTRVHNAGTIGRLTVERESPPLF
jgi:rhodanese-related sulfurtransferase